MPRPTRRPRTWNPRRNQIILAAVLVVGVGAAGGGLVLRNGGSGVTGQEGEDGGFLFEQAEIRCGFENVVTADTRLPADGQFCLTQFVATNTGDEAATLDISCQFVEDVSGERYAADQEATLLDPDGQRLFRDGVGPGEKIPRGLVIFDIPKETEALTAELHGECDSDGLTVSA